MADVAVEVEVGDKRKAEAELEVVAPGEQAAEAEAVEAPAAKKVKPTPLTLGFKTFEAGEDLFLYFANLLKKLTPNQRFNEYEATVTEAMLRKGHKDPQKKIGSGIKGFQIREHPEHQSRCLFVMRTDNTMVDFSYRKCCEALMPLDDAALTKIGLGPRKASAPKSAAKGGDKGKGSGKGFKGGAGGGGRGGGRGRGGRGGGRGQRKR